MFFYEDDRPPFIKYLLASFVMHVVLLFLLSRNVGIPRVEEKIVEVFPVIEKSKTYEIADIERPAVEKRPQKARFLGMYDSSVREETVAVTAPEKQGINKKNAVVKGAENWGSLKAKPFDKTINDPLYSFDKRLFASKGLDNDAKGKGGVGSSYKDDFFPDYKLGDRTYLNVLRYPDVDYFVRMKRQFKMTFNPSPVLRQYFSTNRVTLGSVEVALAVTVDKNGNLAELFILKSSGIPQYDAEAMRTVRASSPFATPPERFVAEDGLLRMSWTFTVYL